MRSAVSAFAVLLVLNYFASKAFVIHEYKDEKYLAFGSFFAQLDEKSELHYYLHQQSKPKSFELSFSKGIWNYKQDGYFNQVRPIGAFLSCKFQEEENLLQNFKYLVNLLSSFSSTGIDMMSFDECVHDLLLSKTECSIPEIRPSADIFYSFIKNIDLGHSEMAAESKKLVVFLLAHFHALLDADCFGISFGWDSFSPSGQITFSFYILINAFEEFRLNSKSFSNFFTSARIHFGVSPQKPYLIEPSWLDAEIKIIEKNWSEGELRLKCTNTHKKASLSVRLLGVLPSFMALNYSSSYCLSGKVDAATAHKENIFSRLNATFRPEIQYEAEFEIKPVESVTFVLEYQIKMANFSAYPYDANRGVDIKAPYIEVSRAKDRSRKQLIVIHPVILPLFQPDFSMPYNIMIIAASVSIIFVLALRKATLFSIHDKNSIFKLIQVFKKYFLPSKSLKTSNGN